MSIIIGLNAYHGDASACILVDGELIAAVEEERFLRIKHWAGFPSKSIEYCLEAANCSLSDVDVIVINSDPKANFFKKVKHTILKGAPLSLLLDRIKNTSSRQSILTLLKKNFPNDSFQGKFESIEHHFAHLASTFYVSPFDSSSVISVDGFGDFASGSWGFGEGSKISVEGQVNYPHSLGAFYQAITQFIGFPNYGDEYKVMGLAPYGKPSYLDEMRQIVLLNDDGTYELNLNYFSFHKEKLSYEWEGGSPKVGKLYSNNLLSLLGVERNINDELTQRHKDLAASAQSMYEEALFHMLNKLHERHKSDNLCLAGGCGNNSVANGKIRSNTNFKNVYVAASAGDAGGAIGAAYAVYFKNNHRNSIKSHMSHAYLGPSANDNEIEELLFKYQKKLNDVDFEIIKPESFTSLANITATAISQGLVIGWFQGSMEWGPRALGNRSILGDPRRADMKDILNKKIKRRESFRPFAPSILREFVSEWFDEDDEVPFMMKVFPVKQEKRKIIPAVTHVDGSGRLQTVYENTNLRYYQLIKSFYNLTGVPILLNTSFNENEPVVCKPEEALDCFLRTNMDIVVLNDHLIRRKNN